ncbi:MAG: MarR family transcriptional regulator [Nanoarchaeota archaeon]|nr:MarR family transcriptional regulator [Nanoarchaeota archaeon]
MSINFACKTIKIEELIKCSFDLTKTEYNVLIVLLKTKKVPLNNIASKLKLERTSIQKAITKLMDKNLVTREKIILDKGGYTYLYNSRNKNQIKTEIIKLVESWSKSAKKQIRSL